MAIFHSSSYYYILSKQNRHLKPTTRNFITPRFTVSNRPWLRHTYPSPTHTITQPNLYQPDNPSSLSIDIHSNYHLLYLPTHPPSTSTKTKKKNSRDSDNLTIASRILYYYIPGRHARVRPGIIVAGADSSSTRARSEGRITGARRRRRCVLLLLLHQHRGSLQG